jgi:hypothetical protein
VTDGSRDTRVFWGLRTRRRQRAVLVFGLLCALVTAVTSWIEGDTVIAVVGTLGVVVLAVLVVAPLRER